MILNWDNHLSLMRDSPILMFPVKKKKKKGPVGLKLI